MRPLLLLLPTITAFAPPQRLTTLRTHDTSNDHVHLQMFTGIVEEMGEVVSLETRDDIELWDGTKGKGTELVVRGDVVLEGAYLG